LTLTPEELSERAVKGHITRKLRLSGNELDNYNQLIPHITKLRESKSLSSIKEMYQNMGMTEKAVSLITKNLKDSDDDDIIDNYDEEVNDTEFQKVLNINNNANIPSGTWVKYEPMKLWVENQFIAGGNFVTSFEDKWLKYQEKKRGIRYTKRGREVTQSRSSIDEFGEKVWKTPEKIKSREQFKEDFIKDISWAIINSIHSFGSKQQYRTYTDDNTGKLIKVQHFNGAEKWMKPEYKELYKDVNEQGYREI
jgi:hypothetical protein